MSQDFKDTAGSIEIFDHFYTVSNLAIQKELIEPENGLSYEIIDVLSSIKMEELLTEYFSRFSIGELNGLRTRLALLVGHKELSHDEFVSIADHKLKKLIDKALDEALEKFWSEKF